MNEPVLPYVLADSIVRNNFYRTTQGNAIPVMVIAKTRLVVRLKIIHFHGADTCRHPDFVKLWHVSWTSAQVADNRRHQWMRWSHFRIGQASGLPFPLVSVHLFLSTVSGRESIEAFVPLLVRDSTYIRSAQPIGLRIAGRTQSFGSL